MRFSSVIDDQQSFTDISQATTSATRFSENEKITLKIFPDAVYFVCRNPLRHAGYFMEIRVSETEVFSSYRMEGASNERNYIVMTLVGSEFAKPIQTNTIEKVKLKLVKRNNKPMLNAEVKNADDVYSKCIPVTICKTNELFEFLTPTINPPIIGLIIKQINSFKDIIETFHELNVETLDMKLFAESELLMKAVTESRVEYCIIFDELLFLEEIEGAQDSDVFRLRVDDIYNFLGCLPNDAKRFSIRVSDLNQIVISVNHSSLDYLFYMSSLVQERDD